MKPKRRRLGIRAQLALIVLVAALLSTVATLYIANSAIQSYVIDQAKQREARNLQVAWLVLHTEFGDNVSIDVKGQLVADSPLTANAAGLGQANGINDFRPYPLNTDIDYVDEVHHLTGGVVAVYQCANERGDLLPGGCPRISTNIPVLENGQERPGSRNLQDKLNDAVFQYVKTHSTPYVLEDTVSGIEYIAAYQAMYSPQHELIGVLFVGEPLASIQELVARTRLQLIIIGALIAAVGIIFAYLLAQAITSTLQNAARQVSAASTKFGGIAAQQASGSAQQVWAINAISQALRNLSETATDVAKRAEQLTQMGAQVAQRRSEISPSQIDSILNYITRSMHDISVQSRQQAATCERMNGAMQAVMEVAQQVARDSQQTTEGAERLEQVVQQLQRLVGSETKGTTVAASRTTSSPSVTPLVREPSGSPGITPAIPSPSASIRPLRPSQSDRMSGSTPQWPPIASPISGTLHTQQQGRSLLSPGLHTPTNSQEPQKRSGLLRSPQRYGPSGDPGPFPSLDPSNPHPDKNLHPDGTLPPTYLPPRREPGGRR